MRDLWSTGVFSGQRGRSAAISVWVLLAAGALSLTIGCDHPAEGGVSRGDGKTSDARPSRMANAAPSELAEVVPAGLPLGVTVARDRVVEDGPIKTQVNIDLIVGESRTEVELRSILASMHAIASERTGFKHHDKATHVLIRAYPTEEHLASEAGQYVAELTRIGADSKPEIYIATAFVDPKSIPADTTGLPEAKRKEIFAEIAEAEYQATRETINLPAATRWDKEDELTAKYKSAVCTKFGVTPQQLEDISQEGLGKNWPVPPYNK